MVEAPKPAAGAAPAPRLPDPAVADPTSAMVPRFNLFFRWFARRFFPHFDLDDEAVARLRALEQRGSVVYVMRYASRLDYFLFNTLFVREGLRLSAFANGLSFYYYAPLLRGIGNWIRRRRLRGAARREADQRLAREKAGAVVRAGQSMFLFLRTARLRDVLRGREAAVEEGRRELELFCEVVRAARLEGRPVTLVPLALFWRKGPRGQGRFLNLSYGGPTRPTDLAKVFSFLITYRDLAIKVGEPMDLAAFLDKRRGQDEAMAARKLRRAMLLFLHREERAVQGPVLRPRHRVQEAVLRERRVEAAILRRAEGGVSPEAARAQAEKIFREIAANMNSTFLAALALVASAVIRRLFHRIEVRGLDKLAEWAKRQPVVLVPSHRSYFDFVLLSWLFYQNHLMPPHIAARENMAFGPFGFLFRRAGAFFLRRAFDDELYRAVFRGYVGWLVREGFTQEFFIEGSRSRTGKTLAPRMGMLAWIIQGFIDSGRRDLLFVPVGITYERLVEEGAMVDELSGGAKRDESVLGLVRARKVLQRRFGSVFVNFGEPLSLGRALETRRELFTGEDDAAKLAERRAFTEALGNDIVERINLSMVANATSVAACVLLAETRAGLFRAELGERMHQIVELLRLQDVRLTPALAADDPEFRDSIDFLLRLGLLHAENDPRGEIVYFEEKDRRALDVYRNVLFHFLVAPSLMARLLLEGVTSQELRRDLDFWLDLLYREFFAPRAIVHAAQIDAFLDHFERLGAHERSEERLRATEKGRPYLAFLAEQTRSLLEAYYGVFSALLALEEPVPERALEKESEAQFRRLLRVGEVARSEGWNRVTFKNALELLARRGVLAQSARDAREPAWGRGPAFDELPLLRERLARALLAR
jgi:glycerol-3-phosphate O-acyltransferase